MKLLILTDIHAGPAAKVTGDDRNIRQANASALEALQEMIPLWSAQQYDCVL